MNNNVIDSLYNVSVPVSLFYHTTNVSAVFLTAAVCHTICSLLKPYVIPYVPYWLYLVDTYDEIENYSNFC